MKRTIAFILCILLSIAMLTACGTPAPSAPSGSDQPTSSAGQSDKPEDPGTQDFSGKTITVGVWGGTFHEYAEEAWAKPFMEKTGATVILEDFGSDATAKVRAQVEQNIPGYDLVCGWGALDMVKVCLDAGALQPIDYSKLSNADQLMDGAKFEYCVGAYVCSTHITALLDHFPNGAPETAADFFDTEKFPGTRAVVSYSPTGLLEQALVADGVAVEDLYPLDVDRAFKKLDTIKKDISKYWSSGAEIYQALQDEEAWVGNYWIGHAYRALDAGVNVNVSNKDATLLADCWAVPTNAQNIDVVWAFLDFVSSPERNAKFCELSGYAPLIDGSFEFLPEEIAKRMPTHPDNIDDCFWLNVEYWQENYAEVEKRYIEWIAK